MPQGTTGDLLRVYRAQRGDRPTLVQGNEQQTTPPQALTSPDQGSRIASFGRGMAKGAGETAFNLGSLVHKTPVLGDLTDALAKMVGPEGTDPSTSFSQLPADLKAKPGAESMGRGVEQFAEFFTPVKVAGAAKLMTLPKAARLKIIEQLASRIPNATSPQMATILNKLAAVTGRIAGDAGTSAAVSTAHGGSEGDAAQAALLAGSGPAFLGPATSAASRGMASFAQTPFGRQLIPYLVASGVMTAAPTVTGLGAAMGSFGLSRMAARQYLQQHALSPKAIRKIGSVVGSGAEAGARGTAAAADVIAPRRRRLQEAR